MMSESQENDGDDVAAMLEGLESAANAIENDEAIEIAANDPGSEFDLPVDAALSMALGAGFGILAPNWNVTANEIDELAKVYAALLEKYLGKGKMGIELAAIMTTAMVIAPRVNKPRVLTAANDEAAPESQAA